MRYEYLPVRGEIVKVLKRLAKHRGITLQELLEDLVDQSVDSLELNEIGYEDYIENS